ncbi:FAD-dependent oxidoreductase [Actinobaculum suis]|uniref:FAD-dependent oxidoreductase n=1 Tax=Actinobaculum suis TaxID=1657 RepID=UPI002100228D|nr:FAD-dependent oxidoreductase [Actinobaculum suis]
MNPFVRCSALARYEIVVANFTYPWGYLQDTPMGMYLGGMKMNNSAQADQKKYVIVGGVAGGMSAATRLRRLDENASITVVERSGYVSFANCGLPYYVGGVIEERDALLLQTPEALKARFNIDVLVHTEVTRIAPDAKTVQIRRVGEDSPAPSGTTELAYDSLILSPGAKPVIPSIPGIERALPLRNIEDTDALMAGAQAATTAVVIGGGFIGVEVTENLAHRGLKVALVEGTNQVMAPLDPEMVAPVHDHIREHGVDLHLGSHVVAIGEDDVELADGTKIQADLVVAAIGVRPDTTLAERAGLALGETGGIAVDATMRTSDPNIYAIGDAAEKTDAISGDASLVALANTANRQGRMVADVIAGREAADRPVLGTSIVQVFDLHVASTGWNEKRLRAAGRAYRAIHSHPSSHAGYYPGAASMNLKLLVDPETDLILGAQGVGEGGIDKRIDVIATAIAGGITASELTDLELAYAPPFGSAKDPINMLGYINRNLHEGLTESVQWHEVAGLMEAGAHLIDVRGPGEFATGTIPGAINLPLDEIRDRINELPDGDLIVSCQVGLRGYLASRILRQHGRKAKNLSGGYRTWKAGMDSAASKPA